MEGTGEDVGQSGVVMLKCMYAVVVWLVQDPQQALKSELHGEEVLCDLPGFI